MRDPELLLCSCAALLASTSGQQDLCQNLALMHKGTWEMCQREKLQPFLQQIPLPWALQPNRASQAVELAQVSNKVQANLCKGKLSDSNLDTIAIVVSLLLTCTTASLGIKIASFPNAINLVQTHGIPGSLHMQPGIPTDSKRLSGCVSWGQ